MPGKMPRSGINPLGILIPSSPLAALWWGLSLSTEDSACPPSPPAPLICFSVPWASWCVINNLEPMFMDSAISAAFKPITFLQRLHEGFLLLQSFCFIYSPSPSSLPAGAATQAGVRAGATGSCRRRGLRESYEGTLMPR